MYEAKTDTVYGILTNGNGGYPQDFANKPTHYLDLTKYATWINQTMTMMLKQPNDKDKRALEIARLAESMLPSVLNQHCY